MSWLRLAAPKGPTLVRTRPEVACASDMHVLDPDVRERAVNTLSVAVEEASKDIERRFGEDAMSAFAGVPFLVSYMALDSGAFLLAQKWIVFNVGYVLAAEKTQHDFRRLVSTVVHECEHYLQQVAGLIPSGPVEQTDKEMQKYVGERWEDLPFEQGAEVAKVRHMLQQGRTTTEILNTVPPRMREMYEWIIELAQDADEQTVVGEAAPPVAYHGTMSEPFVVFDRTEDIGFHFSVDPEAADLRSGTGYNEEYGQHSRIYPVKLLIENPLRLRDLHTWESSSVIRELLSVGFLSEADVERFFPDGMVERESLARALAWYGFDSIVYKNETEYRGGEENQQDSYIVFWPEQIKSVFNQAPDPESPDITAASEQDHRDYADGEVLVFHGTTSLALRKILASGTVSGHFTDDFEVAKDMAYQRAEDYGGTPVVIVLRLSQLGSPEPIDIGNRTDYAVSGLPLSEDSLHDTVGGEDLGPRLEE